MRIRISILLFCFLLPLVTICSQEQYPSIAVLPFDAITVSESDAAVLSGLFETALVKTGVFSVIEQNQISEILEAQKQSLSGCTDESCAVEVGKLLSASQIILGTVSTVGGKYIINAKIIDVTLGKNIRADKVEAASLADLTDAVELLAYKLAGLTFQERTQERVATKFGELFVETDLANAEIYVNGAYKGTSPILIARVPVGEVIVDARKDAFLGTEKVTISNVTARIKLVLTETRGNLFIKSSVQEVNVFIDGDLHGELGAGFIENMGIGKHTIELRGADVYWKEDINIQSGQTAQVEAYPRASGLISFDFPEAAVAEIEGMGMKETVTGRGELPLLVGDYRFRIGGGIYDLIELSVSVSRGSTFTLKPDLEYTREYAQTHFMQKVDQIESRIKNSIQVSESDMKTLANLRETIQESKHTFLNLTERIEVLTKHIHNKIAIQNKHGELNDLMLQKKVIEGALAHTEKNRKSQNVAGWLTFGISAVFPALSPLFMYLSDQAYQDYLTSTDIDEVIYLREQFQTYDILT